MRDGMTGGGERQEKDDAVGGGADSIHPLPRRVARLARAMWRQARQLHLPQTAGSLAFLSLLAIAPMFSIVFWVTTASPMFGRLRDALQEFLLANLFPSSISDTVIGLLNQFAAKANELSVIGLTVFLLTAFVALQTIEGTLNRIWLADRRRPLAHRLAMYWMMLTLGPLLLGASLVFHGIVATSWLRGADLNEVRNVWYFVLPWGTSVAGLALLYRLLPSAEVRWRDALLGAVLAAFLFEFLRTGLGLYVTRLPTYTVVYGTFAALPLFLLWLFLGWMSVLVGALLAANLRFWASAAEPHLERAPAARFDDARAVLDAMRAELGADPYAAMPVERVEQALDGDTERGIEVALLLTRLGYITRFMRLGDRRGAIESSPTTDRRTPIGSPPVGQVPIGSAPIGSAPVGSTPVGQSLGGRSRSGRSRSGRSRSGRWALRRRRAGTDTIWTERWAWAGDPRTMSLRALFEEIWTAGRAGRSGQAERIPDDVDRPLVGVNAYDRPLVDGGSFGRSVR